ncbi:MAG TPA: sulfatase-like hydrolase/transferase, partial [Geminicoccaceae bacterium]|nr:sulfatase-like hydrolase/transferase [Geminicoccaceae bacterium]
RFTHALTPWPVCTPARATMWTGVYPHAHKLTGNVYGVDNAFEAQSPIRITLFDLLRRAGYLTAHFGKWHLGEARPPFFDVWEESFNSRLGHWVDGLQDGVYRPDLQTDACVRFIREQQGADRPFALVQGFYPPHDPFTAPRRFYEPYRGKGVPFAGYYAAVSALDECVGRTVAALEETGQRQNTLLIYYSDHGETFFYRPEGEHKFVCFEEAIRVPFIMSWPGRLPAGAVRDHFIGLQDLMPTVLDYAGAADPIPATLHGRSVRAVVEDATAPWREDFYVQTITHRSRIEQRCLRTRRWKLIGGANGRHSLYDLEADPEEELDIFLTPRPDSGFERYKHVPDHAPTIAGMARRMREVAAGMDDATGVRIAEDVLASLRPRLPAADVPGGNPSPNAARDQVPET